MSAVATQSIYHLPSGYDDNRVVLMARDPHCLFAYWEISDARKESFYREFGHELWEKSVPVLKVINASRNTGFNIKINDFADNWYVHVDDSSSLYTAEIGRILSDQFFIHLAESNYCRTPEDHMSVNSAAYFVDYRQLKEGALDLSRGLISSRTGIETLPGSYLGASSLELFSPGSRKEQFGISSAEYYGMNLAERLGISSQDLMK